MSDETRWEREDREQKEREKRIVSRIAEDLDAYAEGRAYSDETYGEEHIVTDLDEDVPEDWEPRGMWDYFDETYNTRYVVDDDLDYVGVRVMVACGGPNVWVDTYNQTVDLYWGGDHVSCDLWSSTTDEIDEIFREQYETLRCGR